MEKYSNALCFRSGMSCLSSWHMTRCCKSVTRSRLDDLLGLCGFRKDCQIPQKFRFYCESFLVARHPSCEYRLLSVNIDYFMDKWELWIVYIAPPLWMVHRASVMGSQFLLVLCKLAIFPKRIKVVQISLFGSDPPGGFCQIWQILGNHPESH